MCSSDLVTTYEHLLQEHKQYPSQKMYLEHCREIAIYGERLKSEANIKRCVDSLVEARYSIHHHVWDQQALNEFFSRLASDFHLDLNLEAMIKNQHELICVLRKYSASKEREEIAEIRKAYTSLPPMWERLGTK